MIETLWNATVVVVGGTTQPTGKKYEYRDSSMPELEIVVSVSVWMEAEAPPEVVEEEATTCAVSDGPRISHCCYHGKGVAS